MHFSQMMKQLLPSIYALKMDCETVKFSVDPQAIQSLLSLYREHLVYQKVKIQLQKIKFSSRSW